MNFVKIGIFQMWFLDKMWIFAPVCWALDGAITDALSASIAGQRILSIGLSQSSWAFRHWWCFLFEIFDQSSTANGSSFGQKSSQVLHLAGPHLHDSNHVQRRSGANALHFERLPSLRCRAERKNTLATNVGTILRITFYISTLGQKSTIYPRIHILKISFYKKNLIFKVSFYTKFTISKSHFWQNSHFQSLMIHKVHIFQTSNSW